MDEIMIIIQIPTFNSFDDFFVDVSVALNVFVIFIYITGDSVGLYVGSCVGSRVGSLVGCRVGDAVGENVGNDVGGLSVGCNVGSLQDVISIHAYFVCIVISYSHVSVSFTFLTATVTDLSHINIARMKLVHTAPLKKNKSALKN